MVGCQVAWAVLDATVCHDVVFIIYLFFRIIKLARGPHYIITHTVRVPKSLNIFNLSPIIRELYASKPCGNFNQNGQKRSLHKCSIISDDISHIPTGFWEHRIMIVCEQGSNSEESLGLIVIGCVHSVFASEALSSPPFFR